MKYIRTTSVVVRDRRGRHARSSHEVTTHDGNPATAQTDALMGLDPNAVMFALFGVDAATFDERHYWVSIDYAPDADGHTTYINHSYRPIGDAA